MLQHHTYIPTLVGLPGLHVVRWLGWLAASEVKVRSIDMLTTNIMSKQIEVILE